MNTESRRAEDRKPGPRAGNEEDYGFGRSRPLDPDEKERLAREQGAAIASGRARSAHTVLNTPTRRAIFIGGLVGIVVLVLAVAILG